MKALKHVLTFFALSTAIAVSAMAAHPVRSLHDLPSKWTGVAGDLVTRVPATLTINRVLKVTRTDGSSDMNADYEVDASLVLGERTVGVSALKLRSFTGAGDTLEVFIETNDPLVLVVEASILYDEASDTYTLADLPLNGARRFVLTAAARK